MMVMSADMLMELARMRVEERLAEAEKSRLARAVEPEPAAPAELGPRSHRRRLFVL